jgi:hypothetical protein
MIIQAFQSLHSHGFLKIQAGIDVAGFPVPTSTKERGTHYTHPLRVQLLILMF